MDWSRRRSGLENSSSSGGALVEAGRHGCDLPRVGRAAGAVQVDMGESCLGQGGDPGSLGLAPNRLWGRCCNYLLGQSYGGNEIGD